MTNLNANARWKTKSSLECDIGGEIKLLVTEKSDFEYRDKLKLRSFLENLDYQDCHACNKVKDSSEDFSVQV